MRESERYQDLKEILVRRRREVEQDLGDEIVDGGETDIALPKIDYLDQLRHAEKALEEGRYGFCKDSHCRSPRREIAIGRLRGLPFAALCKECEDRAYWAGAREKARRYLQGRRNGELLRAMGE